MQSKDGDCADKMEELNRSISDASSVASLCELDELELEKASSSEVMAKMKSWLKEINELGGTFPDSQGGKIGMLVDKVESVCTTISDRICKNEIANQWKKKYDEEREKTNQIKAESEVLENIVKQLTLSSDLSMPPQSEGGNDIMERVFEEDLSHSMKMENDLHREKPNLQDNNKGTEINEREIDKRKDRIIDIQEVVKSIELLNERINNLSCKIESGFKIIAEDLNQVIVREAADIKGCIKEMHRDIKNGIGNLITKNIDSKERKLYLPEEVSGEVARRQDRSTASNGNLEMSGELEAMSGSETESIIEIKINKKEGINTEMEGNDREGKNQMKRIMYGDGGKESVKNNVRRCNGVTEREVKDIKGGEWAMVARRNGKEWKYGNRGLVITKGEVRDYDSELIITSSANNYNSNNNRKKTRNAAIVIHTTGTDFTYANVIKKAKSVATASLDSLGIENLIFRRAIMGGLLIEGDISGDKACGLEGKLKEVFKDTGESL
jgi:hypothetical protein